MYYNLSNFKLACIVTWTYIYFNFFLPLAKAKVVITANEKVLGDRRVPLKENVDKALEEAKVETVLVAKRTSTVVAMSDHDVDLDEVWL